MNASNAVNARIDPIQKKSKELISGLFIGETFSEYQFW